MKLIDLLEIIPDYEYIEVLNINESIIAIWDGRNHIPFVLNDIRVDWLETSKKLINGKFEICLKITIDTNYEYDDVN